MDANDDEIFSLQISFDFFLLSVLMELYSWFNNFFGNCFTTKFNYSDIAMKIFPGETNEINFLNF